MEKFAVVTADIIDSKKHQAIRETLETKLEEINSSDLLTPFLISRGDEIQAVCINFASLPRIIRDLRYYCRPIQLRIGIGIAEIEQFNSTNSSWNMNGPAFYLARKALEKVKKGKIMRTVWETEDYYDDLAINTIYELVDSIMARWTNEQWDAVKAYEEKGTYNKAAEVLHIAWQSVQKRCSAARWDIIKRAETNLSLILDNKFRNC